MTVIIEQPRGDFQPRAHGGVRPSQGAGAPSTLLRNGPIGNPADVVAASVAPAGLCDAPGWMRRLPASARAHVEARLSESHAGCGESDSEVGRPAGEQPALLKVEQAVRAEGDSYFEQLALEAAERRRRRRERRYRERKRQQQRLRAIAEDGFGGAGLSEAEWAAIGIAEAEHAIEAVLDAADRKAALARWFRAWVEACRREPDSAGRLLGPLLRLREPAGERPGDGVTAAAILHAAVVFGPGGTTLRQLAGIGPGVTRARHIVQLGVLAFWLSRTGVQFSQCAIAQMLWSGVPVDPRRKPCRVCGAVHTSALRYGSDTHLGGHLGYLDALELSGAITWRQLKHRPAIAASGQLVGPSGFPCSTFELQTELAPRKALEAVERLARALVVDSLEAFAACASSARPRLDFLCRARPREAVRHPDGLERAPP